MYSYEWDEETGGLILNTTELKFSKEPRPVYYKELDILGFDKYWEYEKDDTLPYLWAESSNYYYKGRLVAKTKGGSVYTAPEIFIIEEPEPKGKKLEFVNIDLMVKKNGRILESLVQETIKKVYNAYVKYKNKVDVFYVAFSGGKDSVVTLDIVQRALAHNSFKVLFGDTGMEFPDTYKVVEATTKLCEKEGIEFLKSQSKYDTKYTWNAFGPPAQTIRWCCSVHKTAPQILKLREVTGKADFTGMAFIGVRASESLSRSEYEYISVGEKHKGQYNCNPILEWNSAELYVYMYSRGLIINDAYKKGNSRAGCLVCPNMSGKNAYMRRACYKDEVDFYLDMINDMYSQSYNTPERIKEFQENVGWKVRMNGRDLCKPLGCAEATINDDIVLRIRNPKTDWKEWIKTIGILMNDSSPYKILFRGKQYSFIVNEFNDGYDVIIDKNLPRVATIFVKLLKNVFYKASSCICCRECEVDCHNGCINMANATLKINSDCVHCAQCHKVDKGCLVYKSLQMPKGGTKLEKESLNRYSTHAPKMEWFQEYFEKKNEFLLSNGLGSQMIGFFKKFLRDADLLVGDNFSATANVIDNLGLDNLSSWGIMLSNLAYTVQINWFIKNMIIDDEMSKEYLVSKLVDTGTNDRAATDILRSLQRMQDLPFSQVGLGMYYKDEEKNVHYVRRGWNNPDSLVVLYSLYKFAEKCGDYYQFTLSRLLNIGIQSDGVSPTEIFGIGREQMEKILTGLSINYPEFISASFTLNLDNITLRKDKTSEDVLGLF